MSQPRILVVDDESSILMTLAANLELEGFEVTGAESPAQAIELVAQLRFDLVLSDFRMPGMNGLELMRRIRMHDPGVPVVLMTAFALETLVREALGEGAFAVVPKPFSVADILAVTARALARPAVLVVDDDPGLLQTLVEAMELRGVKAVAAADPAAALEAVTRGGIDLCVIDMVMPTTSGPELIERLRAARPELAVVGISGRDVPEFLRLSGRHLAGFMRKPFSPAALIEEIGKARLRQATKPPAKPGA